MPVRVAGKAIRDLGYLHTRVNISELFDTEPPKIHKELERTLDASQRYLNDCDTVIFASATLKRILTIFQNSEYILPSIYWDGIILHIKRVWDYKADCVCYDAVDTFALLLEIHLRQCEACLERPETDNHANCDWINEVTLWLLEPSSVCKARFKCISHLVIQCPTLRLNLGEHFFRRTYLLLSSPTFSTVICQLIVDNIFDTDEHWDLHCQLLLSSSTDSKLIKSRFIPMLQKYHPLNVTSIKKQKPQRPPKSDTAILFLNQLLKHLNSNDRPYDLLTKLEIFHALITSTWPKSKKDTKDAKDGEFQQNSNLVDFSHWSQCIDELVLASAIVDVELEVRLAAFRLIVENPRKTTVFNDVDLEYIKVFLASNMTVQSPSARQQLVSAFKFMCQRLGASSETYLKIIQTSERDSDSYSPESFSFENRGFSKWKFGDSYVHPIPESYIALTKWMAKMAFESLSPKGNFYRRIMALMLIEVLFNKESFITDGKRLFADKLNIETMLGSDRHKLVIDCLDDSYDVVQNTALGLLKKLDFGNIIMDEEKYLREAVVLMTCARSRNSASAGFRMQYYLSRQPERYTVCLIKFMNDVRERASAVENNLMTITSLPVHPILNMIELLLKNPTWQIETDEEKISFYRKEILDYIIPACHRIVITVSPVVHNMSPEGHIPDDVLNNMYGKSLDSIAEISQHLLVCCWRAHKHVSGIFSWIIEELAPKKFLTKDEIEAIGTFYWTQLTECKHRGAFESATEGFSRLCEFLWTTPIEGLPKPDNWLDEILRAIRGEKDLTNLCSTRRSAGLPHLVLSIVATEPEANKNKALMKATDSLLNMEGKSVECRVHSMNVMKVIVQSSILHERATYCYEKALRIAINACRAEWSERNAASQLFAALRTKIFGVIRSAQRDLSVDPKNKKSNYEFFSKFPTLYKFLFDQLQMKQSEFSLLPPLVILTHLYTPASSTELYPLRPFVPLLLEMSLNGKREDIRAHAIAAIVAISDSYAREDLCQWIEEFDFQNARQNHIHTFVLLIKGLVSIDEFRNRIICVIEKIISSSAFKNWCDYNINILLEIANDSNVEYDVDEVAVDKVCLSKRPLVSKLLKDNDAFKSEMSRLLRDSDARKEVYRLICKNEWSVCNMRLRAHIIAIAIADLADARTQQCEAKMILQILGDANEKFMSQENLLKVIDLIEYHLENPNLNWTLPSTMAYATKLRYFTSRIVDEQLITWIRECYELDDLETKQIALDVGGMFICNFKLTSHEDIEKDLISAVALYLQDESEFIRQRTSRYLCHLFRDFGIGVINPEICRLFVLKWCANDSNEDLSEQFISDKEKTIEERDDLFDACAVNQYEEHHLFGDLKMYESCIGFTIAREDMFDMEL